MTSFIHSYDGDDLSRMDGWYRLLGKNEVQWRFCILSSRRILTFLHETQGFSLERLCRLSTMKSISKRCNILPPGVLPMMKQPTVSLALLATGVILICVLAGLAVCSQEGQYCQNSVAESGNCGLEGSNQAPSPALASADQPSPTLAPPRPETSVPNPPYSNELATGKPVYLKIETDQNEIEVGWESP
jgi:hypothetical protein